MHNAWTTFLLVCVPGQSTTAARPACARTCGHSMRAMDPVCAPACLGASGRSLANDWFGSSVVVPSSSPGCITGLLVDSYCMVLGDLGSVGLYDGDIERMNQTLSFTAEEEQGLVIPNEMWLGTVGDQSLLLHAVNHGKGMDLSRLSSDRFLLRFHHRVDKKRTSEGGPWNFENHLIILGELGPDDDPLTIDLNFYDFTIWVHGLPYLKVSLALGHMIDHKLGNVKEVDVTMGRSSLFSSFCVRVSLDVCRTLLRATKYTEDFVDPGSQTPYSSWLRSMSHSRGSPFSIGYGDVSVAFTSPYAESPTGAPSQSFHSTELEVCPLRISIGRLPLASADLVNIPF
ncbi:UNVERIFIED_CONTAM: hypothetical protein Slati_1728800 [Sesamum latifolium]|uniref:Uncharacterized protein n=1 Tax=Sesamum latifolium TaxID=2727402 RepID=A0AAW2WYK1_9LAMI